MTRRLPFGSRRCECPACGELFTTPANFDKHRKGKPGARYCVPPAAVGLVTKTVSGGWTVWAEPLPEDARERLRRSPRRDERDRPATTLPANKIAAEKRDAMQEAAA